MTKFECENKDELKAQCNHYKSMFSAKSFSETSHLRRHLNICLKIFNKDITQYTIATKPSLEGGSSIKTYKFDADECRRAVSTFLVYDKHAFRTVEEPGFRYMRSIVSLNFKNKSRQTTIRDVLMYYAKERDHVKEELAKTHGLICPTSNNWNSEYNNDEYICITAHWVDKDWKLQKRIIRFRGLSPPYDDFVETILCNLKILFDEYVKNSKSMSSFLARNFNVSDNDPIDSSLHQLNVNRANLGGDYDEKSELELNSQIDVLDYWSKSSIRYCELSFLARDLLAIPISTVASESAFSMRKKVITFLRSSLKPKTVQVVVCFDNWM
ncbi:hypothetical protein Goarm_011072 [Gossypium armourianum]|uniref:HAT C-terminal dimerisation domain-containing protein n=1 Tax=Gossypium armourianum TaxID=34283 RepID=A0A7J9IX92_9ROSI|nr:hypothetical protein [Gossypium armourianum]